MDNVRLFDCLVAFFWVLAFFLSLPIVQPEELARLGALVAAFLAAFLMIGRSLRSGLLLPDALLLDLALLFWVWMFASIFWSVAPMVSFIAFCTFSLLPLSFLAVATSKDAGRIVILVAPAIALIITGLALWALLQYFFLVDLLVNGAVRAPFANPNSYAALLSLGFFAALGRMFWAEKKKQGWLFTVAALLTLAAMAVIGSRGVLLSLVPALLIFLWLMRRHLGSQKIRLAIILCGMAMILIATILTAGQGKVLLLGRLAALAEPGDASMGARLDLWLASIAMIADRPWLGTGIGTFFLYYPEYRHASEIFSSGLMAHNDPLQFWVEAGLVAPLLFYLFLAAVVWRMAATMRHITPDNPARAMIVALFCGIGAMALHAHISFNLNVACILLLSGLMLGYWLQLAACGHRKAGQDIGEVKLPERYPAIVSWGFLAMPFVVAVVFLQGFLRSEYHANRARDLALTEKLDDFAKEVNKANEAGFGMNTRPYIFAATIPLGILQSGAALSAEERTAQMARAKAMLDKAEKYNPRLAPVYFYRGQLRELGGDISQAEDSYRKALALNPLHQPSRERLAALYLKLGDPAQALQVLEDGLHWPPRFQNPMAYYNMTMIVAQQQGDMAIQKLVAEKIAQYERAAR